LKKILFIILLIVELQALERDSTLKLYMGIFSALSSQNIISLYTNDREYREIFKNSRYIKLTSRVEDANIALVTSSKALRYILNNNIIGYNRYPILFVTDYKLLKQTPYAVGAFYWRKGRSQLLFIRDRLSHYNIRLSSDYQKFIIDEL